jgi:hypothetical protein
MHVIGQLHAPAALPPGGKWSRYTLTKSKKFCLLRLLIDPEDGGSTFLPNVGKLLPDCTALLRTSGTNFVCNILFAAYPPECLFRDEDPRNDNVLPAVSTNDYVAINGTINSAGRSRVRFLMRSLDYSIYLNLPAALWPCGGLSL